MPKIKRMSPAESTVSMGKPYARGVRGATCFSKEAGYPSIQASTMVPQRGQLLLGSRWSSR